MGPLHLRAYRIFLALYPSEFRAEYARELTFTFDDCWRYESRAVARGALFFRAIAGVLTEAPKEHWFMLLQDIRHGLRLWKKNPGFTVTVLLLLGIGVGATTTIFSVLNALILRPLPYPDATRLVAVEESIPQKNQPSIGMAFPNYEDVRARARSFTEIGLYREASATLTGEGDAERVQAGMVTYSALTALGVAPQRGRLFTADEDRPEGPNVVVLSDALWTRRYGRDETLVGRNIFLGGQPAQVIGIMPRGFRFPELADLWLPLKLNRKLATRNDYFLEAVARLKPGVTCEQADAEFKGIIGQIIAENPKDSQGQTGNVRPLQESWIGNFRKPALILGGAVLFVLMIACANIANLLLARSPARLREMAIRGALGASRGRMVRQLIIENMLFGGVGAVFGIAIAVGGVQLLVSLVSIDLPSWMHFEIDGAVLAFAIAASVASSLLFGMVPAFLAARQNVVGVLKDGARGSGGVHRRHFRTGLVTFEIALSLSLLAGAGLMLRTFEALRNQPLGFNPSHVLTADLSPPPNSYKEPAQIRTLIQRLRTEVGSIGGFTAVAAANNPPLAGTWGRSFTVEGQPALSVRDAPMINHTVVTPGYFRALGIAMIEGRDFDEHDGLGELVTIVDKTIASTYWPGQSALGKRVRFGPPESKEPWHTIIGVCDVVRNQRVNMVRRQSAYLPHNEVTIAGMSLIVRTEVPPLAARTAIRERIRAIDRNIAVSRMWTMDQVIARSLWQSRFITVLLTIFAFVAVLLAAVGVYGVLAESVAQQTQEFGIRIALGASAADVRGAVLGDGLRLIALGGIAGAVLTFVVTRVLGTLLYNVTATDAVSICGALVVLLCAAITASYLPARRAMSVDPAVALRHE